MFITYDNNTIINKNDSHLSIFCEKYFADEFKKCKKFYESLNNEESCIKECPYGFSCVKTEKNIYTCLLIKNHMNYDKVKKNIAVYNEKIGEYTVYTDSDILQIIAEIEKLSELNDIYTQTVHDIKNANKSMMDLSEAMEENEDIQKILGSNQDLYSLVEGYGLIKYRLDYHDWVISANDPFNSRCCSINVHKIITKLSYQLKYRAKKKNIDIKREGSSHNNLNQRVALFLGFFLLIENAIKYSPCDKEIIISMRDIYLNSAEVIIENQCGIIEEDELPKLKQMHFRSKSAISSASGRGLGLKLADNIFSDAQSSLDISYLLAESGTYGTFRASVILQDLK